MPKHPAEADVGNDVKIDIRDPPGPGGQAPRAQAQDLKLSPPELNGKYAPGGAGASATGPAAKPAPDGWLSLVDVKLTSTGATRNVGSRRHVR